MDDKEKKYIEDHYLTGFIYKYIAEDDLFTKFLKGLRTGNNSVFHNVDRTLPP